jgi:hypothetical protein
VSPALYLGVNSITWPWSSLAEENSTVANTVATADHTEASAACRPGHARRPKPKIYLAGLSSVSALLSSRNLSGIKLDGSGYRFSSCEMAHVLDMTVVPDVQYHKIFVRWTKTADLLE